ncbi:hypothetical protein LOZ61_006078 [Ophidiomyces ophidiicola]|uniref:Uncharacterized protein n=1 Tax=Ophidiomyces ophidiicola TaxID=1387563 RepID=A0ACB8V3M0_9EURO|nr:hypothetical protein LOZ61_006078 [Ophidiomyces ophidiicola]KAI1922784.1 hypothetical protein LOZ60_005552 [Ophidiomyces ophidiicola]KAI2135641.1 hypothetical protein LOZ27_006427 [Ophidiomyces ophidiicola]KAI2161042.1 hypothetical protein LOZ25_002479 [Ophidiomyces ophidiicola]KAI2195185.1 hypothetical protein LOZ20_003661 [Ophidiomyces ophidiicola]
MSLVILTVEELSNTAAILADALTACGAKYGIIGGAGVALHAQRFHLTAHPTADIDAIIQPNAAKGIDADKISRSLATKFPETFTAVTLNGFSMPAIRMQRGDQPLLVEIKLFDIEAWPDRPQYDLNSPLNTPVPVHIRGKTVQVMSIAWLLREKILSQAQREGSKKEQSDILDITCLTTIAEVHELACETVEFVAALRRLLEKKPELESSLKRAVKCSAVFH